jgi:tetratricopeptide (TPR) repeat protein
MPTVLNLLGEPIPESIQGESFLPLILGKEEKERPSAYSETYWPRYHYGWSELKSLRKGRFKFIDAPRPELYDVLEDPGEIDNIVNREAKLGHEMKRELESLIERYSAEGIEDAEPKKIDNDSLVKLQALGYIGSFHASSKEEGGELADPKDKIELYNEIKLAQFLVTEEKMEEAEGKIKDVLNKDESVLEARYILGNIYLKQKKYDEAIKEYKKSLAVNPDYYDAIFGLARAYKRAENYDEAIVGFERMITIDSRDTKSYWHLGDIYLEKEEYDKALEYLKTCVEIDPEAPVFHNKLGAVYIKKEMYDLAEEEVKIALSFKRSVPLTNAHFNLALIHEARSEYDLAIMEYRKEQEISPHNFKPDFNLGLLYSKAKEIDKAIEEFQSCIEKNEEFAEAHSFLANAYMDSGKDLKKAEEMALKGLSLKPDKRTTILTHFVLADIYNRLKRYDKYEHHVAQANELKKNLDN